MELEKFVELFAEQFFDTDPAEFKPGTEFRQLEEWSSMTGLCVLTMIKDEYGFFLDPKEFKTCNTIQEVFDAVAKRVKE